MTISGFPIRVLLADDHAMVRESLTRVLNESDRIAVVGQAKSAAEVFARLHDAQPNVLVLDYSMPGMDVLDAIAEVKRLAPLVRILILTVHENVHYAVRTLENGAHGYVIKASAVDELVQAIEEIHRGELFVSPRIAGQVLAHMRRPKRQREGVDALSKREFEFIRLFATGITLQECAERMAISVSSASTYRSRVMEKLNLQNTNEIIRYAIEHHLT